MEFVFNKNGKIHHSCGAKLPKGAIEVFGWKGTPGEPWDWYENGIRISDDDLVKKGQRIDCCGVYYDQNKQEHKITVLDIEPDPSWTKDKWNHHTDALNLDTGKWEEDSEKKEEYEKRLLRTKRSSEFTLFDKYQLPLPWESLSQEQKDQYVSWRDAWLSAPESGTEPQRPEWFQV